MTKSIARRRTPLDDHAPCHHPKKKKKGSEKEAKQRKREQLMKRLACLHHGAPAEGSERLAEAKSPRAAQVGGLIRNNVSCMIMMKIEMIFFIMLMFTPRLICALLPMVLSATFGAAAAPRAPSAARRPELRARGRRAQRRDQAISRDPTDS